MAQPPKPGNHMTDMTTGNPYKLLIIFSLPMLAGNVLQQLYNMVDSIVVGNFVGEKALAAVGTGFPIIFLLSSLFIGISIGATVMISQFYGARDMDAVQRTVSTVYTATLIGIVPLSVLGIVFSRPLLLAIRVPDDGTLSMAVTYMITIFAGGIGALGFNVNAGILQGLGDSRTSLIFLAIAAVLNTVLDLLFVLAFRWGVFGVAFATILAQLCSWLFGIFHINKHYHDIRIRIFPMSFDKKLFFTAMRLGIPSGLQQALFSLGFMFMQSLVNGYGSSFIAGYSAAGKIDSFSFMPMASFANAVTTYTGQNMGARNIGRIHQGTKAALALVGGTSIVITALLYPFSGFLMSLFNPNAAVISAGVAYLHRMLPFFILLGVMMVFSGVVRGAGAMLVPLLASIVSMWLFRVPTAYWLAYRFGPEAMFYAPSIGWVFGVLITGGYYLTGRWKKKGLSSLTAADESAADSGPAVV